MFVHVDPGDGCNTESGVILVLPHYLLIWLADVKDEANLVDLVHYL